MPKLGMEPIRKRALVEAAIQAIHDDGFCDVTVGKIARRAGVSTALAHHYFGSKEHLLAATMRHLLTALGIEISARLRAAAGPRARISAIVSGNFAPDQFQPAVIAAWLAFYVQALNVRESRRLHRIYAHRLRSNLVHDLAHLVARERAVTIAEGVAALIDGFWVRQVLSDVVPEPRAAVAMIEDFVDGEIARARQ